MKRKKILLGMSFLMMGAICTFNVHRTMSISSEAGFTSLTDVIKLSRASAESDEDSNCPGTSCDYANGTNYGYMSLGSAHICCGGATSKAGKKKA